MLGGEPDPVLETAGGAYNFHAEWQARIAARGASSSTSASPGVDLLASGPLATADVDPALVAAPSTIERLFSESVAKKVDAVTSTSAELRHVLLVARGDLIARFVRPADVVMLLRAVNSARYLPMTFGFQRAVLRTLAATASEFAPDEALHALNELHNRDELYHRDVTSTLLTIALSGLDGFTLPQLADFAGAIHSVEHMMSKSEIRKVLDLLGQEISRQTTAGGGTGVRLELSLLVQRLQNCSAAVDQSGLAPALARLFVENAKSFSTLELLICLRYCGRRDVAPHAEHVVPALTERIVRMVVEQVERGHVDLDGIFDVLWSSAARDLEPELYKKLVTLIVEVLESALAIRVDDTLFASDGAVESNRKCPKCGTLLAWHGKCAGLNVHQCHVAKAGPMRLKNHVNALNLLLNNDLDPSRCGLACFLLLWLTNRLTPATLDEAPVDARRYLRGLVMQLSQRGFILKNTGSVVLPTQLIAAANPTVASKMLAAGATRLLQKQFDTTIARGAQADANGLGDTEFEGAPARHLRPTGEVGRRFKLRSFASVLQQLDQDLVGRNVASREAEEARARSERRRFAFRNSAQRPADQVFRAKTAKLPNWKPSRSAEKAADARRGWVPPGSDASSNDGGGG